MAFAETSSERQWKATVTDQLKTMCENHKGDQVKFQGLCSIVNQDGNIRTSLVVQWLRLCAPNAGGTGSTPGQGTKILHASRPSQKKKKGWGHHFCRCRGFQG